MEHTILAVCQQYIGRCRQGGLKSFAVMSVAVLILASAVHNTYAQSATESAAPVPVRVKMYPVRLKHDVPKTGDTQRVGPATAPPASAHLTYYGGPVVSSAQVIIVLYGTGSYLPNLTAQSNLPQFYSELTNSPYMDLLSEYNTQGLSGGSNQTIQHGSYVGVYQITPSAANNGATIDDSQIQAELTAQIQAGNLPSPAVDSAGNTNTVYMTYFPHGKTITQGGSSSCVSGGFCAYHGTIAASGGLRELLYGVQPDMQAGSGCDTGCGSASTSLGNYTSVASHELAETITDAAVGIATVVGPPLAWYDSTNGEIGDICNAQQGTFTGLSGTTWTVQLEWSNAQNNCVLSGPSHNTGDFSISASPSSISVTAGNGGSSTISTAVVSGSGTVTLSVSGTGNGVSAALSPTSVAAGGSSTLTITTTTAATAGAHVLTVTGNEGANTHTTTVTVNVTAAVNDFSISASPASVSIAAGSSGSSTISTATTKGSAQTVSLSVSGAPSGVTATLTPTSVSSGQSSTLNISTTSAAAAGTYTLTVTGAAASGSHTTTVSLTITGGTGGGGIVNGGFESGNLSGWTSSGASETVVNSGCHGGAYCARLGSTTPTNGDSTITQTFTAPSGTTGISLWYKETCPDTVTYDWALVTLKDNTAGTTATLLGKTCATVAWRNLTGNITAGHSYTLSLTSHDDNYAGDATYTLYDDVTLTTTTVGQGITNGGFESGLTGWTATGASETAVSSGCHSGTGCARLGSTTPTNGDSSLTQSFTVPSGKSQLSIWYKSTCPDTVTYDWATVTLKNNSTGTTTTVLAKTCVTNSTWVNVTAAVSAGTSYTLTITSHDDNYAGDATYTLYDDITLN